MSIRPVDIQTTITGSTQASDMKQKQQGLEHIHQHNTDGKINEMDKKALSQVVETLEDQNVNKDGEGKQKYEEQERKRQQEEEKKKSIPLVSDGIRGKKFDFRA